VLGRVQGGIVGHLRGRESDARRRASYERTTLDELARHYASHRVVRRRDLTRVQVWAWNGRGKLRLEHVDGTHLSLHWSRRANRGADVTALLATAFGADTVAPRGRAARAERAA
jgi:hypothetical protein